MPPSWQAIVRRPSGELQNVTNIKITGSGVNTTMLSPGINDNETMVCYCCCPLPYDSTYSTWVAVFTVPISPQSEPMHAKDLQFPLFLPLYPNRDLVIMAFQGKRVSAVEAPATVFLHFPPEHVLRPTHPVDLALARWKQAESVWTSAVKSLSTGSWLSYAFDAMWVLQCKQEEVDDEDLVPDDLEEEVVMVNVGKKINCSEQEDISSGDEDMTSEEENEEEEQEALDVCTGLVQAKGDVIVSSDDEFEEEEDEFEEEEDEEEEEDDKEDCGDD